MFFEITDAPLDPRGLEQRVSHPGCGAILTFIGVVRNNHAGRQVTGLDYQAYPSMCDRVAQSIDAEILERWPEVQTAMAHRVGSLAIGEASIVIATSSPHRVHAYEASRYCIDSIKAILPVWKREHYVEGDATWVSNAEFEADAEPKP